MKRFAAAGLVALTATAGCGKLPTDTPSRPKTLGYEVLREVGTLGDVLSARWVIYATIVVTIMLVLRRVVDFGIRIVWRLGWDRKRALARGQSALDFTFSAIAVLLILRPFFVAAPLLAGSLAVGLLLTGALALPAWIQDFVAGIELATRQAVREGDQIEAAGLSGTVRSIGLLRTRLRDGDGSTITIPNRLIATSAIRVGRDSGAVPVTVAVPEEKADTPQRREEIERRALLCPFRRSGSSPLLRRTNQGWTLTLQSWSTRDVATAQRALEQLVNTYDPPAEPRAIITDTVEESRT